MHRTVETYQRQWFHGNLRSPFSLRQWSLVMAGLIVAGLLAGVSYWYTSVISVEEINVQSFPIQHHAILMVTSDYGDISLHSGLVNTVVVQTTKHFEGMRSDLARMNVSMGKTGDGDTVVVHAQDPLPTTDLFSRSIDLNLTVPALTDMTIVAKNGEVFINDVKGSINVRAENGSINAENIRGQGIVTLRAARGAIDIDNLDGAVNLVTTDGHIDVVEATLEGQSQLTSTNGKIAFDGVIDPGCRCTFSSSGGTIDVTLPSISAFDLYTATKYGRIDNEFASIHVGESPRALLHIQTVDGDILVNNSDD
jgi:hypothetical protein